MVIASHPISFGTGVGLFATAIGTGVGLAWSKWTGSHHERKLKEILDALSTQYLDTFPKYIDEITALVNSAEKSLDILCTYPQHGAFSAPNEWQGLQRAILNAAMDREISVRMVFSSSRERLHADTRQFDEAFDSSSGKRSWFDKNRERLDQYVETHLNAVKRNQKEGAELGDNFKIDDPYKLLWFQDEAEKATVLNWADQDPKADIRETDHLMPFFAWLVDGRKRAIFVVMTYDSESVGHAFSTRDDRLIDALRSLMRRYNDDSRKFVGKSTPFNEAQNIVRSYRSGKAAGTMYSPSSDATQIHPD